MRKRNCLHKHKYQILSYIPIMKAVDSYFDIGKLYAVMNQWFAHKQFIVEN